MKDDGEVMGRKEGRDGEREGQIRNGGRESWKGIYIAGKGGWKRGMGKACGRERIGGN